MSDKRTKRKKQIVFVKTCWLPTYIDLSVQSNRERFMGMFENRFNAKKLQLNAKSNRV